MSVVGQSGAVHVAVVGHLEWVDFIRVDHAPRPGEIVHATEAWALPAGGGPVAAVQLAKLAGEPALFLTALGDDDLGHRAHAELSTMGVRVEAVFRESPTRRAITHLDASGERTITVLNERLTPRADDGLPWDDLAGADAVYACASDAEGLRLARRARVLVATSRFLPTIAESGVELDALVGSGFDESERYEPGDLDAVPRLVVRTSGAQGGTFSVDGGEPVPYEPAPVPGPVADAYGCGDSFAAALAFSLSAGAAPDEAVRFAARCGAAVLTGNGPYEGQVRGAAPEPVGEGS
jgi:ribokinase